MRLSHLVVLASIVWTAAGDMGRAAMAPREVCETAGRAAERANALPANMLVSIGLVESGRVDPVTGQATPWPWTVNVNGAGYYFLAKQDAVLFAEFAEASGARDVDVGCFQISLEHHPDAFGSMDAAFDPTENANVSARFLDRLKIQNGSWGTAIADYHSGVPALGLPYQRLVLNAWRGIGMMPASFAALRFVPADPVVIGESPEALLVRVFTPDAEFGPPVQAGLPRVITP